MENQYGLWLGNIIVLNQLFSHFFKRKYTDVYRPVFKMSKENKWRRIDQPVQLNVGKNFSFLYFEMFRSKKKN